MHTHTLPLIADNLDIIVIWENGDNFENKT